MQSAGVTVSVGIVIVLVVSLSKLNVVVPPAKVFSLTVGVKDTSRQVSEKMTLN